MAMFRTDTGMQAFERGWADGDQYVTRVNKGGLDVERHTDYLNKIYRAGFRLFSIFEQNGNTVMVFERREELDRGEDGAGPHGLPGGRR